MLCVAVGTLLVCPSSLLLSIVILPGAAGLVVGVVPDISVGEYFAVSI